MNAENSIARELPRRTLLCGLGLIAVGMLPSSALALGNVKVLSNGKIEILLSKNTALRKVGGVIQFTDNQGKSIALIRTSRAVSGFRAIDLSCTHQGVTVERTENGWLCKDGHQATYASDGKVLSGPAKIDLRSITLKASKAKVIVG